MKLIIFKQQVIFFYQKKISKIKNFIKKNKDKNILISSETFQSHQYPNYWNNYSDANNRKKNKKFLESSNYNFFEEPERYDYFLL